ncbi:hypothetical protein AX15_006596 [Amanita polypyramis BW_CC]|nr:hypothetical protein AX15_006596 [Amanita polypyramis BW_CC]
MPMSSGANLDLPSEIWTQIFDLAADEDLIFQYGLPTAMAESAWFMSVVGEWALRTPQEALNLLQRRSYATKKAITMTCKKWRHLGSEFLFRTLFFNEPSKMLLLCRALDSSSASASTVSSSIGWWTRRIHLTRYYITSNRGIPMTDLENALVSIIRHCPNLEIFIIEWPMGNTFGPVADALATYARRSLRTVHWCVNRSAIPKVIWALDSLPYVLAAHVDVDPVSHASQDCDDLDSNDSLPLGAAADVQLNLPSLQQLSLSGHFHELLEEAVGWHMPTLRNVTLDSVSSPDQPDAISFLARHGSKLVYLDLDCITAHNVPIILDLCRELNTFVFNGDWSLSVPGEDGNLPEESIKALDLPKSTLVSRLVRRPHEKISTIGLRGLELALGTRSMEYVTMPWRSWMGPQNRRSNDLNVNALDKIAFPNLKRVRAVSRPLLIELNRSNGPSPDGGCMERWEKWWQHFANMNVRLEDCTGEELGVLPGDEEDDDDDDDEEEEEDSWNYEVPPMEPNEGPHMTELRQLLAECRAMEEDREEPMFPMFGMMGMGAFGGMGGMGGMGFGGMGMGIGGAGTSMAYGGTGRGYGSSNGYGGGGYGGPSGSAVPRMGFSSTWTGSR